jgi:hypothetical protein
MTDVNMQSNFSVLSAALSVGRSIGWFRGFLPRLLVGRMVGRSARLRSGVGAVGAGRSGAAATAFARHTARVGRWSRLVTGGGVVALMALPALGQSGDDRRTAPPLPVSGAVTAHDPKPPTARGLGVSTVEQVIAALNEEPAQQITEKQRSWKPIFDAYIDMTAPPMPVGPTFNVATIHPKMREWDKVAAWAKANPGMAAALKEVRDRVGFALPYGEANVDEKYRSKGLCVRVGVDGDLRRTEYPYIAAIDVIAAYSTAEMYRLLEEGKPKEAFAVAVDSARLLRMLADRVTVTEKGHFFDLLSELLAAQRDAMWLYREKIPTAVLVEVAKEEYPFLLPRRSRLEMPEGERIIAEAIIRNLFDEDGQPNVDKFASLLGGLQARQKPLTAFGAVKRWRNLADLHGSLDASIKRLVAIYDDWWRRWRMKQYDPIVELPTELSRTNPVRYGAVTYAISDIQPLFEKRKRVAAEICGAAIAAGLAGYYADRKAIPDDREKAYATYCLKATDLDPWDREYGRMLYRFLGSQKKAVDTPNGRVWVDGGVLYARGRNLSDDDFNEVSADGSAGDFLVWPPMRALEREQGIAD